MVIVAFIVIFVTFMSVMADQENLTEMCLKVKKRVPYLTTDLSLSISVAIMSPNQRSFIQKKQEQPTESIDF